MATIIIKLTQSPELLLALHQLSDTFGRLAATVDTLAKRMADREEVFAQATQMVMRANSGADVPSPFPPVVKPASPSGSVDTALAQPPSAAAPAGTKPNPTSP